MAESLTKRYRRWGKTRAFGTLKSAFLGRGLAEALAPSETVPALTEASFTVGRGETFGVIGPNGSGKSTLLKLVAGILKPTSGRLSVDGKVSALIELGAGFHPEITGRENVVINGVMLGLKRREIERRLPEIVAFSGLQDFIDQPVKTYSSGMYVRLGFAVAVHVDPDILVVDEVLAVGDEAFARRCLDVIAEFRSRGKTIFFVSHSLSLVEELYDRVLYLSEGRVKGLAEPREMLAAYRLDVAAGEGERLLMEHRQDQDALRNLPPSLAASDTSRSRPGAVPPLSSKGESAKRAEVAAAPQGKGPVPPAFEEKRPDDLSSGSLDEPHRTDEPLEQKERLRRWGDRSAVITAVRLLGADGVERYSFRSGETLVVEIEATPARPLDDFVFGIGLFNPEDVCVHGSNTEIDGFSPVRFDAPALVRLTLPHCDLGEGTYLLDVAVHGRRGTPYDYWRGASRFQVHSPARDAGVWRPERRWSVTGGASLRAR